jgi:hypothetical protein
VDNLNLTYKDKEFKIQLVENINNTWIYNDSIFESKFLSDKIEELYCDEIKTFNISLINCSSIYINADNNILIQIIQLIIHSFRDSDVEPQAYLGLTAKYDYLKKSRKDITEYKDFFFDLQAINKKIILYFPRFNDIIKKLEKEDYFFLSQLSVISKNKVCILGIINEVVEVFDTEIGEEKDFYSSFGNHFESGITVEETSNELLNLILQIPIIGIKSVEINIEELRNIIRLKIKMNPINFKEIQLRIRNIWTNGNITVFETIDYLIPDINKTNTSNIMENPNIYNLKGSEIQKLRDALVDAFPSEKDMNEMTQVVLDKPVNHFVSSGTLLQQTFELINKVISQGLIQKLIMGAFELNPDNPHLKAFVENFNENFGKGEGEKINNFDNQEIINVIKEEVEGLHKRHDKNNENLKIIKEELGSYHNDINDTLEKAGLLPEMWRDLQELIEELNNNMNEGFLTVMNEQFDYIDVNTEEIKGVLEEKYTILFEQLKKSSDSVAKIKFVIPILKLLDLSGIPVSGALEIILKALDVRFEGEHKLNSKIRKVFYKK